MSAAHGKGTFYKTSAIAFQAPVTHPWIQYRVVFTSENGDNSAVLKEVRLTFR